MCKEWDKTPHIWEAYPAICEAIKKPVKRIINIRCNPFVKEK